MRPEAQQGGAVSGITGERREQKVSPEEVKFLSGDYGASRERDGVRYPCYDSTLRYALDLRDQHFAKTILAKAREEGVEFGDEETMSISRVIDWQLGSEVMNPTVQSDQFSPYQVMAGVEKLDFSFFENFAKENGLEFDLQKRLQAVLEKYVSDYAFIRNYDKQPAYIERLFKLAEQRGVKLDFNSAVVRQRMQEGVDLWFKMEVQKLDQSPDMVGPGAKLSEVVKTLVEFAQNHGIPVNIGKSLQDATRLLRSQLDAKPKDEAYAEKVRQVALTMRAVAQEHGVDVRRTQF